MKVKVKRTNFKSIRGDLSINIIISNICAANDYGDTEVGAYNISIHEAADEIYGSLMKFWMTAESAVKEKLLQSYKDMKEAVDSLDSFSETDKKPGIIKIPSNSRLAFPKLGFEISRHYEDDKESIGMTFNERIINVDMDDFISIIKSNIIICGIKYSVKIDVKTTGIDIWGPIEKKFIKDEIPKLEKFIKDEIPKLETDLVNEEAGLVNESEKENSVEDNDIVEENNVDTKKLEMAPTLPTYNNLEYHYHAQYYFSVRLYHEDENAKFDIYLTNALTYLKTIIRTKLTEDPTFKYDYTNGYISASFINDGVKLLQKPQSKVPVKTLYKMISDAIDTVEKKFSSILLVTSMTVDPKTIPFIYPIHDIMTLSSCKAMARLVTMLYQFRFNKGIDNHSRGKCFERIKEKINNAYEYGYNVIMINDIFIRITNKNDSIFNEEKHIDHMVNIIMAVLIATGGDFEDIIYDFKIKDIDAINAEGKKKGWRF